MAEARRDYTLSGWRVASAIDLPELPLWPDELGEADVEIVIGEVPATLPGATLTTPFLQTDGNGRARNSIAGVADYLIEYGRRITVAPAMDPNSPDVRLFLLGSVFGVLCNQRGVLPLHACSIEIDGRAVAFAGASGAGKSTLAAAFERRGFRVLADDVTPIEFGHDGVRFLPGVRRIKLWSDAMRALEWKPDEVERCRKELEKFGRIADADVASEALKPGAVFHLNAFPETNGEIMLTRLKGAAAVQQMRRQVYRWRALQRSVGMAEAMARVVRATSGVPRHFELWRHVKFDRLDSTIDTVLETLRLSR